MNVIFGQLLKKHRILNGFTQAELGKAVGLDRISICNLETGRSYPCLDNAILLANYLGFSLFDVQKPERE